MTAVAFGDGIEEEERAFGLFGGGPGCLNEAVFRLPDGTGRRPKSKEIVRGLSPGTIFRQVAGGGYGDPHERPAETVAAEIRDGVISRQAAEKTYGVVLTPDGFAIDKAATARRRG